MAKGQQRSNREKKKPKQAKKPAAPAATFGTHPNPQCGHSDIPGEK